MIIFFFYFGLNNAVQRKLKYECADYVLLKCYYKYQTMLQTRPPIYYFAEI